MKRITLLRYVLLTLFISMSSFCRAADKEAYAELSSFPVYMLTFYYDDLRSTRQGKTFDMNQKNANPGWYSDANKKLIAAVLFDSSFKDYRPTSTAHWFETMERLTAISGMKEYLYTSEVTTMNSMFAGSGLVGDLDFSEYPHFDTGKVTDMSVMFCNLGNIENIDISNFDTSNVTNMDYMFAFCSKLKTVDINSFDTKNVRSMNQMFQDDSMLTTIYVGKSWNVETVSWMLGMFNGCTSLVGGAGTKFKGDDEYNYLQYAHVDGGSSNPGYLTAKYRTNYAVFKDGTMTFYYDAKKDKREGKVYNDLPTIISDWYNDRTCYEVTTVVFDPSFANYKPLGTTNWFMGMENLTEIKGMKEYLNTTDVTGMGSMFEGCRSLEVLDLTGLNTMKVAYMYNMFKDCTSLKTILVGKGWRTWSLKDTSDMFFNCRKLVGGAGTKYDGNHIDGAYAHIDGGTANPGYLTDVKLGDVNRDGAVDVADISTIIDFMAGGALEFATFADVNGDKSVDVADISTVIDVMAGSVVVDDQSDITSASMNVVAVDLGLPSGTKWANMNVGAEAPEDFGQYFAWGETQQKNRYGWSMYIHCDGTAETCHDLGSDIAGTQYDAATANWKGPWRMPTMYQWQELIDNCTSVLTTLNGVEGRRFTGPNRASIFLPAAGYIDYEEILGGGVRGLYWTSTPMSENHAYEVYFYSNDILRLDDDELYYGQPVRPVLR